MSSATFKPLELNRDFREALDLIEKSGKNAFITGRAGTGKSTLLGLFKATTRKKIAILAPTGVAALNVKGQTIHSFFGFPARPLSPGEIKKVKFRKLYQNLETIVIDEISMVRADLLDNIDLFLRINRNSKAPFGGVQMIFFGDLFQLPPVVASDAEKMLFNGYYESPYFFSANVFREEFVMEMIELQKVYRQESRLFLRLLEAIRTRRLDYDDLEDLNSRYVPDFPLQEYFITVSPRNLKVDRINREELAKLDTEEFTFSAEVSGSFDPRLYPVEAALRLKKAAQVMFVKNDPEKQFVNGTIGKISYLGRDKIIVSIDERGEKKEIEVQQLDWEIVKHIAGKENDNSIETEVIGSFRQYPLKLAWAITIHKSQGKTFDKVIIDMGGGAFEHGQTYVALSRCRTLEGIVLKQKIRMEDVLVDPKIIEFYEQNF